MPSEFDPQNDIVLVDDQARFRRLFHDLSGGLTLHEFLRSFVRNVRDNSPTESVLDLKNVTGDHLAECHRFVMDLIKESLAIWGTMAGASGKS